MLALIIGNSTLSGKVGNTVYMKNGRTRELHVTATDTPSQQAVRNVFSNLAEFWTQLTATQRLSWREAAATGNWNHPNRVGRVIQPSGFQLFMRLNGRRKLSQLGGGGVVAVLTTAPAFFSVEGFTAFSCSYVLGVSLNLDTADTDRPATAGDIQVLEATARLSVGVDSIPNSDWRTIGAGAVGSTGDITGIYESIFGADTEGAGIHLRMCIQDAGGNRSGWIYCTATL